MATEIYGEVSNLQDIRDINRKIRQEMNAVLGRDQLTELRSGVITSAPSPRRHPGRRGSVTRATGIWRSPTRKM